MWEERRSTTEPQLFVNTHQDDMVLATAAREFVLATVRGDDCDNSSRYTVSVPCRSRRHDDSVADSGGLQEHTACGKSGEAQQSRSYLSTHIRMTWCWRRLLGNLCLLPYEVMIATTVRDTL